MPCCLIYTFSWSTTLSIASQGDSNRLRWRQAATAPSSHKQGRRFEKCTTLSVTERKGLSGQFAKLAGTFATLLSDTQVCGWNVHAETETARDRDNSYETSRRHISLV
ncbi:putative intraflagellar transport protein [Toxoplasma gondii GT1]|uniref:Putative intraflagellar transport protein n=1 Tax=Toxoplasma gondii (strain ATCC 50853 / GT1) TaxID=507601 RepID=S7UQF3_TOXGG|nr:putative intraflagellar transport protein [Toxoplasma gondii GT1]